MTEFVPLTQQRVDHGTQGSQPDPAGHQQHIASDAVRNRPARSERSSQAQRLSNLQLKQGTRHIARQSHGVVDSG